MKKILFMGGLSSGGAEHQMVLLACSLKREGYNVSYLSYGDGDFYQNILEDSNISLIRIKERKWINIMRLNTLYVLWEVGRELHRVQYDTVVSFLGFWNYINCYYSNKKKTAHRAITGIRNNRKEVFLSHRDKYYTKYEKYSYKKVSNSDAAKESFCQCFPEFSDKLTTIYNLVNIPRISSSYLMRKDNRLNVIVPASYRKVKNPMGMLEGIRLMREDDRKMLHIDWYGNKKNGIACYNQMIQFIKDNNLNEVVTLHDSTKEMANRINEADMVGLFSTSEGLPNAICEGMMLAKPIVMTRVSDYKKLVDSENGFLCDAKKPESIAQALSIAVRLDIRSMAEMGKKSRQRGERLFSEEAILKQWKALL